MKTAASSATVSALVASLQAVTHWSAGDVPIAASASVAATAVPLLLSLMSWGE